MAQKYIMEALAQLGSGERDQPVAHLCNFSSPKYSACIQYQVNIMQRVLTITTEPREHKINIFNGIQVTPDSRTKAVYEMFLEGAGLKGSNSESHEFANSGGLQFLICVVFHILQRMLIANITLYFVFWKAEFFSHSAQHDARHRVTVPSIMHLLN